MPTTCIRLNSGTKLALFADMRASMLRPVALPSHLAGRPAPCDIFDAKGTLLQKAGSPLIVRSAHTLRRHRVFCEASKADSISAANPIAKMRAARTALSDLAERAESGQEAAAPEFIALAGELHDAWQLDPDACIGYARLDYSERSSVCHAVLAALIAAELAAANGLPRETTTDLIGAALTMNLGSMAAHDELFALPEAPKFRPSDECRMHPLDAVRLLESLGSFPFGWLQTVVQHHESIDGTGYPQGLTGLKISLAARMLRIADALAAKFVVGRLRTPQHWNISKAKYVDHLIQHVFGAEAQRLDLPLVRQLMTRLGFFPPGTLVRLSNGETAVVNRRLSEDNAPPREAISVLDARGRLLEAPRLRPLGTRDCRIQSYVHDELHRLPHYEWQQIWGYA